ncbi:MAG: hypothetical protein PHU70_09910, partial [Dehalococcoidia bacterium]|nr:hypothetical protein [Dehalococcoidia bacterium]
MQDGGSCKHHAGFGGLALGCIAFAAVLRALGARGLEDLAIRAAPARLSGLAVSGGLGLGGVAVAALLRA